jgi:hypothetical protein
MFEQDMNPVRAVHELWEGTKSVCHVRRSWRTGHRGAGLKDRVERYPWQVLYWTYAVRAGTMDVGEMQVRDSHGRCPYLCTVAAAFPYARGHMADEAGFHMEVREVLPGQRPLR